MGACLLLLPSCAFFHRSPRPQPDATKSDRPPPRAVAPGSRTAATPRPTPAAYRVGVVRVIGSGQRFVLVEVPSTTTTPLPGGQLLRCCPSPDGDLAMTATLRVSPERRRPYVVADIVSGEPHVGDSVFLGSEPTPAAATGNTVLPTATSGVLPIVLPAPRPAPKAP